MLVCTVADGSKSLADGGAVAKAFLTNGGPTLEMVSLLF